MSRDPFKTWQTYIRAINFIFLILDYDFRVLIPPKSDFAKLEIDHTNELNRRKIEGTISLKSFNVYNYVKKSIQNKLSKFVKFMKIR